MTSTADQPINALRTGHDELAALVKGLSLEQISGPSGAADWTIAQVLSHLGSGAEIGLAGLEVALGTGEKPAADFNRTVWDRWDAMEPADQAAGFVTANEKFVVRYESLDDTTRNETTVDLGFLPAPVDLATAASFRLNEFALHSWDVRVAGDPSAVLAQDAAEPLMAVVPYLIGWLGKPGDLLGGATKKVTIQTTAPDRTFGLAITEKVALVDAPDEPDATVSLSGESWLRLATGRLGPENTPGEVRVTGDITIGQLRQMFPGY
ncbi:uncharacterized protein (TIGR03083 family) [Nakamurella sp. UYEF19]|uniref:maleylpyruvate isomerase family mycothiol-dependent enzyme n=1 Tax=Nakamurella sp. UYEF19 TaxID=1756392 RepID=UPI0033912917